MTVVLLLALRIILILLLLRFLLRFVGAVVAGYRGRVEEGRPKALPVELVRDEVCNTYLPRSRALAADVGGRTAHFCSPACRDRARAAHP